MPKYLLMGGLFLIFFGFILSNQASRNLNLPTETTLSKTTSETSSTIPGVAVSIPNNQPGNLDNQFYEVVKVVDGDTIDVMINGKIERLRLIGINTPETMDPRKPVECFGLEASNKAKDLLSGEMVRLETDPSQGELDKYFRLLRYVFLEDGTNFNLTMVQEGYAYEYTYDDPYTYQNTFKAAQQYAESNKLGLWGETCGGETSVNTPPTNPSSNSCSIKGNVSSSKEKIYHVPGCGSYEKTIIDESAGERWFCSEQNALDAGWRKAKNC